ncbi:MAG: peptidoglycan-binding protein [Candidatus Nitricoxidivorans perseverans]|uniref:Peptidoglycan-binding protein n=1 Tax=Candidatus Nitricoxidivorans perseverans TaxID=2975601 RepID=A0AA49FJG1_9PROT|nr:MAG: peptidoglycan-binding protein [Candidatus Nitricoxidivorans perseverans]
MQKEQAKLDPDDLQALGGLGFLVEGATPTLSAKARSPSSEPVTEAVNSLRASFGWDPHGRATRNTVRALRAQVAALQRKLAALDLYRGEAHGRFDDGTRKALEQFQATRAPEPLAVTGVLDAATRKAMDGLPPYTFDEVLCAELDAVNHGREEVGLKPEREAARSGNAIVRAHQSRLLGAAFSGGGIRSATFNLGVLQALARLGLLRRVDYLSTVSGGGYVGGWLHAWVNREKDGISAVERNLAAPAHEPRQVSWLRRYSNYLTPRIGLLSPDTMAGVATWLRNVLLNQTILAALGLLVLCLPWLLFMLSGRMNAAFAPAMVAGAALLLIAVVLTMGIWETLDIERHAALAEQPSDRRADAFARLKANVVIVCAALAALLLSLALPGPTTPLERMLQVVLGPPAALLALLLIVTVVIGLAGRRLREATREWWSRAGGILISILLGWLALAGVALLGSYGVFYAGAWITALGGIVWLATTVAGVILGRSPSTGNGKGGWKNLLAGLAPWVFVAGLLLALSLTLYAAITRVGDPDRPAICQPVPDGGLRSAYRIKLELAPDNHAASGEVLRVKPDPGCSPARYAEQADRALANSSGRFGALLAVLAVLSWLLGRRVDINVFAFHMFYRNRLERCYLGASNPVRRANPFTDLDPHDAPMLSALKRGGRTQRPYPLINTALNIARSSNLAWQERKAASFLFTPEFCGYQLPGNDDAGVSAYQKTDQFLAPPGQAGRKGWLGLGTPITISGAAASPNAGYHTNPATAFLMTVFNVRLGWWMQNTRKFEHWTRPGPGQSIPYLLKELLAATTDTDEFVYMSDGGHFENLGIYELVRRRCRYIIACDAGCDPDYTFEDLGNAIRKCRIDLGIEIEINPGAIMPDPDTGHGLFHCAVGRIHYERTDPVATAGYLLYIKTSLTGDEPADINQYKAEHADFPHESTGDQWYSESQFESYRGLGRHVATKVLSQAHDAAGQTSGDRPCRDLERFFHALSEQWYPPSRAGQAAFSKHGAELEDIYDRMREDPSLRFLDAQIYPEWAKLGQRVRPEPSREQCTMLPLTEEELRAGFYLCNTLIQLMENVYADLRLEDEYAHPDNRGWMNLFRHWSWSGMFRVTWAICVATYGARFQEFCRRHMGLECGELALADAVVVGDDGWRDRINVLELEHVHRIIVGHYAEEGADGGAEVLAGLDQKALAARAEQWVAEAGRELVIQPLEIRVSDPSGKQEKFVFPVGFALLAPRSRLRGGLSPQGKPAFDLVYYRIRDHLRRVGLGREGLRKLRAGYGEVYVDMPPTLGKLIREADPDLLQHLWHLDLWADSGQLHRPS